MKKIYIFIIIIISFFMASCSLSDDSSNISIKGDFNVILEVGEEYIEPGIKMPSNYYLKTEGIILQVPGFEQEMKYKVYSPDGELKKELSRYVKYVDTKAPTYEKTNISIINMGLEYNISDFISSYEDNYSSNNSIKIVSDLPKTFKESGVVDITIKLTDQMGNTSTYNEQFTVGQSVQETVRKTIADGKTKRDYINGERRINLSINESTTLNYYSSKKIELIKKVSTNLKSIGNGEITISTKTNDLANTLVTYKISSFGSSSIGNVLIDTSSEHISFSFNTFLSFSNLLNVNENEMVSELKELLPKIYEEFYFYLNYDWDKTLY